LTEYKRKFRCSPNDGQPKRRVHGVTGLAHFIGSGLPLIKTTSDGNKYPKVHLDRNQSVVVKHR
jgi:hypothetical protein